MHIRRALVTLILVGLSGLSACGSDDDTGSADDPTSSASATAGPSGSTQPVEPDNGTGATTACSVLTTDEVAAAVGSPVEEGVTTTGPAVTGGSFDTCVWQSADPDNPADTATLTLYPNAAAADSARSDTSEDVDGIGDAAFTVTFAGLWVYVGDTSFFAQWYAFSGSDEENLPKSEALARAAADRL